ncbi:hypothetical protein [Streptomyces sp. NPDC048277]|uniref:hypothetical protein n=1 Tax=Streptomyces sp. NPDC048277 TaxID=3155027 RepID=UPI0033DE0AF1
MPTPSEHTRLSLEARLGERARTVWPRLEQLPVRHRGSFAYVEAELAGGERGKLMRLRYVGAVGRWGFALYHAGSDRYEDSLLPTGSPTGTPAEVLDCACRLHLAAASIGPDTDHNPDYHRQPPKDFRTGPLRLAGVPSA